MAHGFTRSNTGAYIGSKYVLTTASNTDGTDGITVFMGHRMRTNLIPFEAVSFISHPDYQNTLGAPNNIGIITLAVNPSSLIEPIALPRLIDSKSIRVGETVTIYGFGLTEDGSMPNFLQHADQEVTACEMNHIQKDFHFCAKDDVKASNMCGGDVGGPAVVLRLGRPVLAGLVSFVTYVNCAAQTPAVYVNIQAHRAWIYRNTGL